MSVLFIYFFSDILKKKKKQGLPPQGKVVIGSVCCSNSVVPQPGNLAVHGVLL